MNKEKIKVPIPKSLYSQIEILVEESPEFNRVEQFVKFVLEEVLKEEPEKKKKEKVYSEEEEEEIKDRLRSLGYL